MKVHTALRRYSTVEPLEARIAPATFRWNLAGSGNWNAAASWFNETTNTAGDGFPNAVDDVAKFLTAATATANVTIAGVNVAAGSLIFDDNNTYNITASGGGSLTLQGVAGASITVTNVNGSGGHAITAPVTFASPLTIDHSSTNPLSISGVLSDGGAGHSLTKNGGGQVTLIPTVALSIFGTTTVNAGTLILGTASAVLSGAVIIGGAGGAAALTATTTNLIADNAPVTVNALGTYTASGNDTIGALTINDGTVIIAGAAVNTFLSPTSLAMTGGSVTTTGGNRSLFLSGNVTATASATQAALIGGVLNLGGLVRTFDIAPGPATPALTISATITVTVGLTAGLTKTGAGALQLAGNASNTYGGTTRVNEGLLLLAKTSGNAIPAALIIGDDVGGAEADGVRLLAPDQISNVAGANVTVTSSGLLDLNGNNEQVVGLILAGGRATTGQAASDLRISNVASLQDGQLEAEAAGSRIFLPTSANFTIASQGNPTIEGRGTVQAFNGTSINFNITDGAGDGVLTVLIPITGVNTSIAKNGTGTLALNAVNTYGGGTTVFAVGTLSVGGSIGDVTVNAGATLTGGGTVGAVTAAGFVRPDSLATGNFAFSSSPSTTLAFHIDGTTPGDGPGFYDQLAVTGTVSLNDAPLVLTGGADFASGEKIVLIDNDGADAITGTFNLFSEGAPVFAAGRSYLISYVGGDGNDVVLTPFQYRVFEGGTQPDGDDIFIVRCDVADAKLLHVTVQSSFLSTIVDVSLNEFAGVLFRGGAGNDALIFDGAQGYFTSTFPFVNEIIFDGGSGTNSLRLNGSALLPALESVTYTPAGPDGGTASFSNDFSVAFDGVSQFFSSLATGRFEYSGTIGAADEIAVLPGAFPEEAIIAVPGQVPVTLRNQTAINLNGGGGADRFRIGTFAAAAGLASVHVNHFGAALATLAVEGSTGADTFTFNATTRTITRTGQPTISYEDPVATIFDGGAGDDVLQITNGSALGTTFIGGPGTDGLSFATSTAAVGFNADRLGSAQTLNGLGWELTLGDLVESFTGSTAADSITIAPGTTQRSVSDPNGTGTLILDGLGSPLTINGPLLNNATGTVTLAGLADSTLSYGNIGLIRTIHVPANSTPVFGSTGNTFAAPLDFDSAKGAARLATGDLNGDGRADFVTLNAKTGSVLIGLSTTAGLLLPAVQKLTGGKAPASVALGDFNGDGDIDIAVTNSGTGTIGIFINDGTGAFGDATIFPVGNKPGTIRVGDVDGDGDADLAAIIAGNKLALLKNNGTATFSAATALATGAAKPRDFAFADLDSDGDLDLAILHTGGQLATNLNDSTATFAPAVLARAGAGATALAIADFNNDGRLDIAVTHNSLSRFVAVLLGQGTGALSPALRIAYPLAAKASAIVASDFDGDGIADLAISHGAGGIVRILRSLGTGNFARTFDLTLEDLPPRKLSALALGDFDGDGRTDIAALSGASGEVSIITRA